MASKKEQASQPCEGLMFNRLSLVALLAASLLAGCRAGSGINAVPSGPQSSAARISGTATVQFVPIGPTHMSDGYPTSGKVNAFAVDPNDSQTIYMASGRGTGLETYSSAGVYRT